MSESLTSPRLFFGFFIAALSCAAVVATLDAPLHTSAAPNGVISFELAWSVERSQAIVASWDTRARLFASCLQGLDYLFLCLYSMALALGCLRAQKKFQSIDSKLASLGRGLFYFSLIAGVCDCIENVPLTWMIFSGEAVSPLPQIATIFASIKFLGVVMALLYMLAGLLVRTKSVT